jgi:hypothetical protein
VGRETIGNSASRVKVTAHLAASAAIPPGAMPYVAGLSAQKIRV